MSRRAGGIAAVIIASLAVSGCTGGDGGPGGPQSAEEDLIVPVAEYSGDDGGVEGVVTDESLLPIADANVTLEENFQSGKVLMFTFSTVAGEFAFSHVPHGTYRVRANATGFADMTSLVTVRASEVAFATITVQQKPGTEPYMVVAVQSGLIRCVFAIVITSDFCAVDEVMGESTRSFEYVIEAGHKAFVVESTWVYPGVTMDYWIFTRNHTDDDPVFVGDGIGMPILRKDLRSGQLHPGWMANIDGGPAYFPVPESQQPFLFDVFLYYDGQYQQEANQTAGPACTYFLGYCAGLGVAVDYRYTQYTSIFYHQAPDDLAAYTAVPPA